MENYIDYNSKFVVIGDSKYSVEEIEKIQKNAKNFDGSVCNIENLMRFAKVRKLAKEIWNNANVRDPIFGKRKYGFVTVSINNTMLIANGCMEKFRELVSLADDFMISDNVVSFAVYKIWD